MSKRETKLTGEEVDETLAEDELWQSRLLPRGLTDAERNILLAFVRGNSIDSLARDTGMDRKTVAKTLSALRSTMRDIFGETRGNELTRERITAEDYILMEAISSALEKVSVLRLAARDDDGEAARLGEDTRRLIAEMQRDLNLKAV